jgi:hypothetical protein
MVKVKKVSAGDSHTVGISLDDTLVGWGSNDYGQLSFPPNIIKVKDVAATHNCTFAIKDDGSVIGFGVDNGQQMVKEIPSGLKAKKIAVTEYQCIAIKEDGSIAIWGKENPIRNVKLKDAIPADFKAKDLSVTDGFALFILEDDTVAAFGVNDFDQLDVPEGLKAKKVVAETTKSFAIDLDDKIHFWGYTGFVSTFTPPSVTAHDIAVGASIFIVIEEESRNAILVDLKTLELSKIKLHSDIAPESVTVSTDESIWIILANGEIEGWYADFVSSEINDTDVYLHEDQHDDDDDDDDDDGDGDSVDSFDSLASDANTRWNHSENPVARVSIGERIYPHALPKIKTPIDLPADQIKDATIPAEVFDPFMASDVSTAEYIAEDKDNAVFIIGAGASGYPKDQLINDYKDGSAIVYQCPKQMGLVVTTNDVIMDTPYYRIKTGQGNLLVPLVQFMSVLGSNHQIFQLSELKTLEFTVGRAAISTNRSFTLDGQPLNLVGMDHCTAGTTKKVYSLTPVKAAATGGKVNHKTKKVRSHKRNSVNVNRKTKKVRSHKRNSVKVNRKTKKVRSHKRTSK